MNYKTIMLNSLNNQGLAAQKFARMLKNNPASDIIICDKGSKLKSEICRAGVIQKVSLVNNDCLFNNVILENENAKKYGLKRMQVVTVESTGQSVVELQFDRDVSGIIPDIKTLGEDNSYIQYIPMLKSQELFRALRGKQAKTAYKP